MNENSAQTSWRFPKEFWIANVMELCERAAYYGFFIVLTLYLTDIVGFTDKETGFIAGTFFAALYFLPPFVGAIGDRIGFKRGLLIAFALLSIGYFFLGIFHSKFAVIFFLGVIMVGASFIKPLITGTVAKTTNEVNRARGFSLFYWVVNIGAFSGKTFVPYIRLQLGVEYVNFFSSGMAVLALIVAAMVYEEPSGELEERKSFAEVFTALKRVASNARLMSLTVIVAGFWIIQHQLYATMPKYVIRMLGEDSKPEWLANVNPLTVVLFVVLITQLMRKRQAVASMFVGMIIMPFAALAMAAGAFFDSDTVSVLGLIDMHPLTLMMIVGIAIQGLAECFISPRFLEYFSLQAPAGEEGVYLGFSHLHSFISALAGFFMSGFLLEAYCPDPKTLPEGLTAAEQASYYSHAHYIWYYFAVIGAVAAVALAVFWFITHKIDAEQAPKATTD